MRRHEIEELARPLIPGRGGLSLRRVGSGLYHDTYRVARAGRQFALRVASETATFAAVSSADEAAWEAAVRHCAARAGLATALLASDSQRGIFLFEWFEGRAWTAAKAAGAQVLAPLTELLRQVHALPIPAPARVLQAGQWIDKYTAALRARGTHGGAALQALARQRLQQLRGLPPGLSVICHSDLHRRNVLARRSVPPGRPTLTLLDWEYCHVSEPLWDLASWSANDDYDAAAQCRLLQAYRRADASVDELLRLSLLVWLYDYVCLLWGELYLCLHPRRRAGGIAARNAVLAARLSSDAE